ncbi:MAG: hypothetical protein K2O54_03490 [Prevotella sp.]|nr:hypothetical protein [Prevotella sp.]
MTIEELKALPVGEWVWLKHKDYKDSYLRKASNNDNQFEFSWFSYSDYGETWIAYKNKEEAECKGELFEFPCMRKVGEEYLIYSFYPEDFTIELYRTRSVSEAEERLGELQGLSTSNNRFANRKYHYTFNEIECNMQETRAYLATVLAREYAKSQKWVVKDSIVNAFDWLLEQLCLSDNIDFDRVIEEYEEDIKDEVKRDNE